MKHKVYWTNLGSRLLLVNSLDSNKNYNWVFLPGGPGLGSESLSELTKLLCLPGNTWHLDLPNDGSNIISSEFNAFSNWSDALVEAISTLENVILIAHSTGAMFVLSTPKLENILIGLVIMDSAPDASWQEKFINYTQNYPLESVIKLQKVYANNPSNEQLKMVTIASAPYLFTENFLEKGVTFLSRLPYNFRSYEWAAENFDKTYKAKWIPKNIPTLIFAGEKDYITPLELFIKVDSFKRDNIYLFEIKDAGHFPWIDNPTQVVKVFREFCSKDFITT